MRPVRVLDNDTEIRRERGGVTYLTSRFPLGPYPARLTDKLDFLVSKWNRMLVQGIAFRIEQRYEDLARYSLIVRRSIERKQIVDFKLDVCPNPASKAAALQNIDPWRTLAKDLSFHDYLVFVLPELSALDVDFANP